jgi:hypothetical protein
VFCGHEALQGDGPVFATGEAESEHPAAPVMHCAQHREMRAAYREQRAATGGGMRNIGGIGEGICRAATRKLSRFLCN